MEIQDDQKIIENMIKLSEGIRTKKVKLELSSFLLKIKGEIDYEVNQEIAKVLKKTNEKKDFPELNSSKYKIENQFLNKKVKFEHHSLKENENLFNNSLSISNINSIKGNSEKSSLINEKEIKRFFSRKENALNEAIITKRGNSSTSLSLIGVTNPFFYVLNHNYLNMDMFSYSLTYEIKKNKIKRYSEEILSGLEVYFLIQIQGIEILGFNVEYNERIKEYDVSFRCDAAFIYDSTLYIIENKYSQDRDSQAENAIKCIKFRRYPQRLLNFLFNSYQELKTNLKFVVELGITLSNNCYVAAIYEKRKVEQYDIDEYKDIFFINRITRIFSKNKKNNNKLDIIHHFRKEYEDVDKKEKIINVEKKKDKKNYFKVINTTKEN